MVRRRVVAWRRPETGRDPARRGSRREPGTVDNGDAQQSGSRWSWPQKTAAVVLPLIAAWGVTYFAPGAWGKDQRGGRARAVDGRCAE